MSERDLFEGEAPSEVAAEEPETAVLKPITEGQWKKILGGQDFKILVDGVQQDWAGKRAVHCISCKHAGKSAGGHDPWRAYCLVFRCMVSNTFPKLCRAYQTA